MASPYNPEVSQGAGGPSIQPEIGDQIPYDSESKVANDAKIKKVFRLAMESKWDEVLEMYTTETWIQGKKITSSEDTLLHIAVIDDRMDIVGKLVNAVTTDMGVLLLQNDMGNTPLHLAAATGKVDMCKCLTGKHSGMIEIRNKEGETPLFVAALHGKTEAFLYLFSRCPEGTGCKYWRRNSDGNSILHVAISGEYFGIVVEPLKVSSMESDSKGEAQSQPLKLPENYSVCLDLLAVARRLFYSGGTAPQWLWSWFQMPRKSQPDAENPQNAASIGSNGSGGENHQTSQEKSDNKHECWLPRNYETCYDFFKLAIVVLRVIGFGFIRTQRLKDKKKKHTWAAQIVEELVTQASSWEYDAGRTPQDRESTGFLMESLPSDFKAEEDNMKSKEANDKKEDGGKKESPLLIAAKMGVKEMVEKILNAYPVAVQDNDRDGKNVVLLAVENRQPHVYKLLLRRKFASKDSAFHKVDHEGNSALHLAATLVQDKPWLIPGAALQMQWEIKWYQFVKKSMPRHSFSRLNKKGETSKEVFTKTHQALVKHGGKWLTNTSQSCSVVAALIATVAFATATAVPGGVREDTGTPTLEGRPAFELFAITSLIALCFSVTSLTMFLAILTSRYEESDFRRNLPLKVILGLTSLFVSIASILVSFCAGHFFVLRNQLKIAVFPVYAATCFPITLFAAAQFPLYWDLIKSSLTSVPQRTFEVTSL